MVSVAITIEWKTFLAINAGEKSMNKILKLSGMHCPSCEVLLQDALMDLSGVEKVKGNFKKNELEVSFDENKVSIQAIKQAIEKENYKVANWKRNYTAVNWVGRN